MNKSQLIDAISTNTGVTKTDAAKVLNAALETIQTAVASGEKVELNGFGAFEATYRKARVGRNPQTGAPLQIAASWTPTFGSYSDFKTAVREGRSLIPA